MNVLPERIGQETLWNGWLYDPVSGYSKSLGKANIPGDPIRQSSPTVTLSLEEMFHVSRSGSSGETKGPSGNGVPGRRGEGAGAMEVASKSSSSRGRRL